MKEEKRKIKFFCSLPAGTEPIATIERKEQKFGVQGSQSSSLGVGLMFRGLGF